LDIHKPQAANSSRECSAVMGTIVLAIRICVAWVPAVVPCGAARTVCTVVAVRTGAPARRA